MYKRQSLRYLLDGPPRPARVCGVGPAALFVSVDRTGPVGDAGEAGPEVLAVCTHDSVRLPLAIVLAASSAASPWAGRVGVGDAALVGAGSVRLCALTVHVVRWWFPARPRPVDRDRLELTAPALVRLVHERGVDLPGSLSTNLDRLRLALATGDHDGARRAVDAMLGLGPGLTPAGDDAVAGLLLAVHHLGEPREPAVARLRAHVLAAAPRRTNGVSAALLSQAAKGYAAPQVIAVLDALGTGPALGAAVSALLRLGHTSGSDLAHGIAAGALLVLGRRSTGGAA